jgi:hypothetical protein
METIMAKTESRVTTNHDEIRHWTEEHNGKPVRVKGTGAENDPGILRIDFPGGTGNDKLEPIPWDAWFQKFDNNHLAFLYQVHKKTGEDSTFFKLIHNRE